jgi:hypothetical protein
LFPLVTGWRILLTMLMLAPGGCTTVDVAPGEARTLTAIGIVRVKVPAVPSGTLVVERSGVGLGWDDLPGGGVWLGFSAGQWVIADPAQCQLVVIVRTKAQAENAVDVLSKLKGEAICVVDQSGSLER